MTLNEYCEYIRNPLSNAKARVVIVPPGESSTTLRRFYQVRGSIELRLSDLVTENTWLPMPSEILERVFDAIKIKAANPEPVVLLGGSGYLGLLTEENRRSAIFALREWLDGATGREAVLLLQNVEGLGNILREVFANPRYRQGKQLIEIDSEQAMSSTDSEESERVAGRPEVMLVGKDLASYIPGSCETFQKYLRHTEDHPNGISMRRVVVASEGRELAGLSAAVRQVVSLRDFARVFYNLEDAALSEEALRWICERGKEGEKNALSETLKTLFFPQGEVSKRILRVFDESRGIEREAVLWLVKQISPKGSYLERIVAQEEVVVGNFRSAYVTGATEWLDDSSVYAVERRDAIQEADVPMSGMDIRQFITRCTSESTSRVAAWLNCGTDAERADLLRRCAVDGLVSNAVKAVYPEAAMYMNSDLVFGDLTLEEYFMEYRELKMAGRVTPEFYMRAQRVLPPESVQSRDAMVQRYASDGGCALLVVDAMGAEWLPMLVTLALKRNLGVDSVAICEAHLPTSTKFNNIHWPDVRCLQNIKRLDNIVHNGDEMHEVRRPEENLAAALNVIGGKVLPHVAEGLTRFERVLVTADHGSSRLAVLAWQAEPRLAQTLPCEAGAEIADWRYRERAAQGGCPPELEETLDGRHWVVRGYDRLPKSGGGQSFELHGGATLEERLVPVVVFSRTGQFVPKARTSGKRAQIVEKDDFDL
ncbi:BREX-4 system phosphatase PglZ [Geomonas ferrireducens]|uniref:BREX-4 system phosphatase PglZ n=1 Tax=Geomonas ferrireducens TaxID=2570227 RepID=UPI0010A90403|nr:BREX-4 system phosphatase PglZ [Geomonas ferrireducens]